LVPNRVSSIFSLLILFCLRFSAFFVILFSFSSCHSGLH
jgi:hypothetical protein